jgi:hypothetical protein
VPAPVLDVDVARVRISQQIGAVQALPFAETYLDQSGVVGYRMATGQDPGCLVGAY